MVRPAALAAAAAVCALGACGGSSDDAPARSDRVTEPSRPAASWLMSAAICAAKELAGWVVLSISARNPASFSGCWA